MRKFLLAAALSAIALSCPAESKQALTLHMESGARIVYYLDTEPSIGFNGQAMTVTVGSDATDIPMQEVARWEIGQVEVAAVAANPAGEGASISVRGSSVSVQNPAGGPIAVYSAAGVAVASGSGIEAEFTLPRGIYVITLSDNTYKISIR